MIADDAHIHNSSTMYVPLSVDSEGGMMEWKNLSRLILFYCLFWKMRLPMEEKLNSSVMKVKTQNARQYRNKNVAACRQLMSRHEK